ncbi:MAG TPA: IclR family transcriptional regulator C-terminal domain-containing protein [Galbitalea sp.]|nr:IclR family transcriptional regulator C-terminal domain-containing protein [Galbitalea sp.]
MPISRDDRDFVQTLERGLAVLHAFDAEHEMLTLRETADAAGISRPAARRLLLTLEALGYLTSEGSSYRLTPQVLRFADAYLGSRAIHEIAQRQLVSFSTDVGEAGSMSMLDGTEIVLVVRTPVNRMRSYLLGLGERMPAYATAQGRVLLADLSDTALNRFFQEADLRPLTGRTLTDESRLRAELTTIAQRGWALLDQEYETNMRSIGVPIRDYYGEVVASIGCMCNSDRVSLADLRDRFIPRLQQAAANIEAELGARVEIA